MEKTLYRDKKVMITNRRILFGQKTVLLAAIRAIEIQQIKDQSHMYKTLAHMAVLGIISLMLWGILSQSLPYGFLLSVFFGTGIGFWWLIERVWPFAVIAETQEGKEIVELSAARR